MLWYYIICINIIAFIAYGVDKRKAINGEWRIPEATLIGLAALGGGAGALLGMKIWHHKTRKWKFKILVPLFLILWAGGIGFYLHTGFQTDRVPVVSVEDRNP